MSCSNCPSTALNMELDETMRRDRVEEAKMHLLNYLELCITSYDRVINMTVCCWWTHIYFSKNVFIVG